MPTKDVKEKVKELSIYAKYGEDRAAIERLFRPYATGRYQFTSQISKGVQYVGIFGGFGEVFARSQLFRWDKVATPPTHRGSQLYLTQEGQEKMLDAALARLKNCVVFSTTAMYHSQFSSACLLKSRGFELVEGKCYDHPGYKGLELNKAEHPGAPDRRLHWEHIWMKVLGEPGEIGDITHGNHMHNCGVDTVTGLEGIKAHEAGERRYYLTVAWLARGVPFPKGWKRFYSAPDYKLGVNFPGIEGHSSVQECPHNFDLDVLKGWEPDFEKWAPT